MGDNVFNNLVSGIQLDTAQNAYQNKKTSSEVVDNKIDSKSSVDGSTKSPYDNVQNSIFKKGGKDFAKQTTNAENDDTSFSLLAAKIALEIILSPKFLFVIFLIFILFTLF